MVIYQTRWFKNAVFIFIFINITLLSLGPGIHDENQKKFIPPLEIDNKFFNPHLPILVRCKVKGAIVAVFALLSYYLKVLSNEMDQAKIRLIR
jgi:uncharacterized membrane protein (DUF106 family)